MTWLLSTLVVAGLMVEITNRVFFSERLQIGEDERTRAFQHDIRLGWKPIPNVDMELQSLNTTFSVSHNSKGFRDREHGEKSKPRLAIVGDSFVWGYDVEEQERFSNKLQTMLPEWDVLNLGVSGYGMGQTFLLMQETFDDFKPDVVFLLKTYNDRDDNKRNFRYGAYYKPVFLIRNAGAMELVGVPVPKSIRYYAAQYPLLFKSYLVRGMFLMYDSRFRPRFEVQDPTEMITRAIYQYVDNNNARLVMGFQQEDEALQALCDALNVPVVTLRTGLRFKTAGSHWTPDGHTFVAEKIFREFSGLLDDIAAALPKHVGP